jgi:Kef-type K+ transport system membrane component KefB
MTATQILGFIGILLVIGFLADFLFRKTSFPDILILLALGYLIGPVFHIIDPSQPA